MYKDINFSDFRFDLITATAIRFRKEPNTYFGEIQPNVSSLEVRTFHTKQMVVQRDNRASDNWHKNNSYLLGHTARRSMIPIPEPLLVTLASFDHDAARNMFTRKIENGFYVTGLNHEMDARNPQPICIVLEPFHDKDFENGVDYQFGCTKDDCYKLSKCITTTSRKYRGPAD
eukprot:5568486-Amphidinium_carterae.1